MKIKIWNAFASNNSGSYTIVGNFPTAELAQDVATELAKLVESHHQWIDTCEGTSPLSEFARQNLLTPYKESKYFDDWPYPYTFAPEVMALEHQVFVHHPYVITLPALFGQYFYARGGRVEVELNHSHHPIVAIFTAYVPHEKRKTINSASAFAEILKELTASEGPLSIGLMQNQKAAWKIESSPMEQFIFGACFSDLLKSFAAIEAITKRYGVMTHVKLFEAPNEHDDPLGFLRQNCPAEQPRNENKASSTLAQKTTDTSKSEGWLDKLNSFVESLRQPKKP
jgi:hypothetical protein